MIEDILLSIGSAILYSAAFYIKKVSRDDGEQFDKFKLAATIVVGAAVGIGYQMSGIDFTQQEISTKVAMYAGTVALVESGLKTVWRKYLKKLYDRYSDSES